MPMPPETLGKINHALDQLSGAEQELALAMRAGLDELPGGESLKTAGATIAQQRAALLRIKNTYYPNQ